MKYRIVFDKPAEKFLRKQDTKQQERLLQAISKLPDAGDIKPLKGYDDLFRLRVGNTRVLYSVENNLLIVRILEIGNRGDIYK